MKKTARGIAFPARHIPGISSATRKYMSESDAKMLIELFASPQGQELVRKFLAATVQAQHAGLTPMQARDRAAAMVSGEENDRVLKVYNGMTSEQRRGAELFSQSSDYRRIQLVLKQIAAEFEQATKLLQEKRIVGRGGGDRSPSTD